MSDRKEPVIVFCSDLDNTLIYSRRREIGEEKVNVEVYEGRAVSFMTYRSCELLKKVRRKALLVPVTTRTEEQYNRIDLKQGVIKYALVCNGGVLLQEGREVPQWYERSLQLTEKSREELACAEKCMQDDGDRILEVRNIRDLFLFTKSRNPLETVKRLEEKLDASLVKIFRNGSKVYVLPEGLDKGTAVRRFHDYIKADTVYAAGDSEFDVPMLEAADLAWASGELAEHYSFRAHVTGIPKEGVFSDLFLERLQAELSFREYRTELNDECKERQGNGRK